LVPDPYWVMQHTSGEIRFWLTIVLAPSLAIMPRFLTMYVAALAVLLHGLR
jgi:hypothetical protein